MANVFLGDLGIFGGANVNLGRIGLNKFTQMEALSHLISMNSFFSFQTFHFLNNKYNTKCKHTYNI